MCVYLYVYVHIYIMYTHILTHINLYTYMCIHNMCVLIILNLCCLETKSLHLKYSKLLFNIRLISPI